LKTNIQKVSASFTWASVTSTILVNHKFSEIKKANNDIDEEIIAFKEVKYGIDETESMHSKWKYPIYNFLFRQVRNFLSSDKANFEP
jgi:hypothetical protein